jgi:hypothetical protein
MKVSKVPLRLEPPPEGGFTVTSPALPGLAPEATPTFHASDGREALDRRTGDIRHVKQEATRHGGVR